MNFLFIHFEMKFTPLIFIIHSWYISVSFRYNISVDHFGYDIVLGKVRECTYE